MSATNLDGHSRPRKNRKKKKRNLSAAPPIRAGNKVTSESRTKSTYSNHSTHSLQQLQQPHYGDTNDYNAGRAQKHQQRNHHSRYATAPQRVDTRSPPRPKPKSKSKSRKVNKIKSRNKPQQAISTHSNSQASSHHHRQRTRSRSNPRSLRHKFNMTEMQLVIGQIAEMKASWKTPAEAVMDRVYQMVGMDERPHLNGKHCKVMLILDEFNYRVALLGNASEHVVAVENLRVAFETENLFLLYESQNESKSPSNRNSKHSKHSRPPQPTSSPPRPPHTDADEVLTIQGFETSFHGTYEFRRYDFYVMACCVILGLLASAAGLFLYLSNGDVGVVGVFAMWMAPWLLLMVGLYCGCAWYCCAVWKGKMEYYLGTNRCCGFECKKCDVCGYQYFVVVALMGVALLVLAVATHLFFDDALAHATGEHRAALDLSDFENVQSVSDLEDSTLFFIIEMMTALGGVGLCCCGLGVFCCCTHRKSPTPRPSIHNDDFDFAE